MKPSIRVIHSAGYGLWRSLVARLTGGQEVVGSNPASPTIPVTRSQNTHR